MCPNPSEGLAVVGNLNTASNPKVQGWLVCQATMLCSSGGSSARCAACCARLFRRHSSESSSTAPCRSMPQAAYLLRVAGSARGGGTAEAAYCLPSPPAPSASQIICDTACWQLPATVGYLHIEDISTFEVTKTHYTTALTHANAYQEVSIQSLQGP